MTVLRVATRASALAVAQAGLVASALERSLGVRAELTLVRTSGDRIQGSLAAVGGKGLFVKELEDALLAGRADLAVHSAKDLPADLAEGTVLAAFPERADPRDALVAARRGATLAELPRGARSSWPRAPISRSCRSAGTSTRASASSRARASTPSCSPARASSGSASRRGSTSAWRPRRCSPP